MLRQIRSGLAKKRDDKIHIRACERETHKYKTYILTSIDRFKMAKKKSVSNLRFSLLPKGERWPKTHILTSIDHFNMAKKKSVS